MDQEGRRRRRCRARCGRRCGRTHRLDRDRRRRRRRRVGADGDPDRLGVGWCGGRGRYRPRDLPGVEVLLQALEAGRVQRPRQKRSTGSRILNTLAFWRKTGPSKREEYAGALYKMANAGSDTVQRQEARKTLLSLGLDFDALGMAADKKNAEKLIAAKLAS